MINTLIVIGAGAMIVGIFIFIKNYNKNTEETGVDLVSEEPVNTIAEKTTVIVERKSVVDLPEIKPIVKEEPVVKKKAIKKKKHTAKKKPVVKKKATKKKKK